MAEWNMQWDGEAWRAEAEDWVDLACTAYSLQRSGPLEPAGIGFRAAHFTAATDQGLLFLKALSPGQLAEATITAAAAAVLPQRLIMPLAIEPERGWMLSPDYGATFDRVEMTDEMWERLFVELALLQLGLLGQGDQLFDAGLLHLDPVWMPEDLENQLMLHASLPSGHPLGIPANDAEALLSASGGFKKACALLAAGPVPLSLDHGSFDRGRVFLPGDGDAALRIQNLGDACWGHPFTALAHPLRRLATSWNTTAADPRIMSVIGSYLGQWADFGTPDELYPLLEAALLIEPMHRHATWMRLLSDAPETDLLRFAPKALEPLSRVAGGIFG